MADGMKGHRSALRSSSPNEKGLPSSWPWRLRRQKIRNQPRIRHPHTPVRIEFFMPEIGKPVSAMFMLELSKKYIAK